MANRNILRQSICAVSVLALLVAVTTSPLRPARQGWGSSCANGIRRNFGVSATTSTHVFARSFSPRTVSIKVVAVENETEEELSTTTHAASHPIDPSQAPSSKPERDLATFGLDRVTHPLRC